MNGIKVGMAFLLATFTICVCGCGTSDDSTDEMGGVVDGSTGSGTSFQNDILPILTPRCAFSGCHVAGGDRSGSISAPMSQFYRAGNAALSSLRAMRLVARSSTKSQREECRWEDLLWMPRRFNSSRIGSMTAPKTIKGSGQRLVRSSFKRYPASPVRHRVSQPPLQRPS